jgi:hypothetical protein
MTNIPQTSTSSDSFSLETLRKVREKSQMRAEFLREEVDRETKRISDIRLSAVSVEGLVEIIEIAEASPKEFPDGVRSLRAGRAAYFFSAQEKEGVCSGFFKWETPECRPTRLFHASAIDQISDPRVNLRAVVLTPAGANLASAQEYLVHLETSLGIPYPHASAHGTAVKVELSAFKFVSA